MKRLTSEQVRRFPVKGLDELRAIVKQETATLAGPLVAPAVIEAMGHKAVTEWIVSHRDASDEEAGYILRVAAKVANEVPVLVARAPIRILREVQS